MRDYKWNIYTEDDNLIIELNGGINSIMDMKHEKFDENKEMKRKEIEYFSTFTKTSIEGGKLLGF